VNSGGGGGLKEHVLCFKKAVLIHVHVKGYVLLVLIAVGLVV